MFNENKIFSDKQKVWNEKKFEFKGKTFKDKFGEYILVPIFDAAKEFYTGSGLLPLIFYLKEYNSEKELLSDISRIKNIYRDRNVEFKKIEKLIRGKDEPKFNELKHKSDLDLILDKNTGNTLYILGSSKTGKSTLLMYLFKKYFDNRKYITSLFSENIKNKNYQGHKKLIMLKDFDDEENKYINTQKYINDETDNEYNFLNMFDDIIDVRYKKLINKLFLTYRNSNLSTIISLQYMYLLSKQARTNINAVCLFGFNNDNAIEAVIKTWLKGWIKKNYNIEKINDMVELYKDLTENHGFIYIHIPSKAISLHRLKL